MRCLAPALVAVLSLAGCSTPHYDATNAAGPAPAAASAAEPAEAAAVEPADPDMIERALGPWTGDYDAMVERRLVRALVPYSRTNYFVDEHGRQRGASYDALTELERTINEQVGDETRPVRVLVIPVRRDQFLDYLEQGRADVALGNIAVTPERRRHATFSSPIATGVDEVVVTSKDAPPVASLEDLAGREVFVHRQSADYEYLTALNADLAKSGKAPVKITPVDDKFDDEDVLEMTNAGVYPTTVVHDDVARLWADVLPNVVVHSDVALSSGGEIAWLVRDGCPKLLEVVDAFVETHKQGTAFGNMVIRRYFGDAKWLRNATAEAEIAKFRDTVGLFKKYAGQYDFDYLLVAAQAYQESGIDQSVRSPAGAVGVMQVLPSTAAGNPVNITGVDVVVDRNIHAGVKYMRFMMDEYFKDARMDRINKSLFAFASYNAGPNRIARLRKEAAERGLDPNEWFQNVELVAAQRIGRETTTYVANIYKYYVAYKMSVASSGRAKEAKSAAAKAPR
jgi:membrane-bound lytic murein transglycosylase MltF